MVRGDKLLLVPVDNALQLRPSLAHLDKPAAAPGAAAGGAAEAAEEEDVKPELQAVKVSQHHCCSDSFLKVGDALGRLRDASVVAMLIALTISNAAS